MAYTLVGTIGAVSVGTAGSAVTPAWGAGESRTAGNLLILFVSHAGAAIFVNAPSGWTLAQNALGTSNGAAIFYKIAAGGDAAPTVAAMTGGVIAAQLAEFSGNRTSLPFDAGGFASTGTSPITATMQQVSAAPGELIVMAGADFRSTARTPNDTWTSNHATITQAGSNNGVSSVNHYSFGYALATNSNTGADTAVMTCSATQNITGLSVAAATFKLPAQNLTRTTSEALSTSTSNAEADKATAKTTVDAPTIAESAARVIAAAPILRSASESIGTGAPVIDDQWLGPGTAAVMRAGVQTVVGQAYVTNGGYLAGAIFAITPAGTPTTNLYAKLYEMPSGIGGNPGAVLATSAPVNAAALGGAPSPAGWTEFDFDGSFYMAPGTVYGIACVYEAGDTVNYINIYYGDGSAHSGFGFAFHDDGSGWINFGGSIDIGFVVNTLGNDKATRVLTALRSPTESLSTAIKTVLSDSCVAQNNLGGFNAGTGISVGQRFTCTTNGKLKYTQFSAYKGGSCAGNSYSRLFSVSGGLPGTLLATSDPNPIPGAPVGPFTATHNFTGANQFTMVAGTDYIITWDYDGNVGGDTILYYFSVSSVGPGYMVQNDGAGFYIPSVDYDKEFFLYVTQNVGDVVTRGLTLSRSCSETLSTSDATSKASITFRYAFEFLTTRFIVDEGFEGTGAPPGWMPWAGAPNFDYTTTPLAGSQSLRLANGDATYYPLPGAYDEIWVKLRARWESYPSPGGENDLGYFWMAGPYDPHTTWRMYDNGWMELYDNNFNEYMFLPPPDIGVAYDFWFHLKTGIYTLTTGLMEWIYAPAGSDRPAWNSSLSNGNGGYFQFGFSAAAGVNVVFDNVQVAPYDAFAPEVVRIISAPRTASEALSTVESASGSRAFVRSAAEALSTSETATRTITSGVSLSRTASESLSTTELATRVSPKSRTATDALSTAESITKAAGHPRTASESLSTSEAISKSATHPRTATDSLTIAEVASRISPKTRTTVDALTAAMVVGETTTYPRPAADALSTSESAVAVRSAQSISRSATEALVTSENLNETQGLFRSTSDTPTIADLSGKISSKPRTGTESLACSESTDWIGTLIRSATDVAATNELALASKFSLVIRTATDSITVSESTDWTALLFRTLTDALTLSETASKATVTSRSTSDAPHTAETLTRTVSLLRILADALSTSEAASKTKITARSVTDAIFTADAASRLETLLRAAADALSTSELAIGSKFGVVTRTTSENLAATAVATRVLQALRSCTENPILAESISDLLTLVRSTTDHPFTSDSTTALKIKLATASDALAAALSLAEVLNLLRQGQDSVTTLESILRPLSSTRSTTDSLSIAQLVTRLTGDIRTAVDSLVTSMTSARTISTSRASADALLLSAESAGRILTLLRSAPGVLSTSELASSLIAHQAFVRDSLDALSISQSVNRILFAFRKGTDLLATSDTLTQIGTRNRTSSDHLFTTELLDRRVLFGRQAFDAPATAESIARLGIFGRSTLDFLSVADSLHLPLTARFAAEFMSAHDLAFWNLPQVVKIVVALEAILGIKITTMSDLMALKISVAEDPVTDIGIVLPTDPLSIDIPLSTNPTQIEIEVSNVH